MFEQIQKKLEALNLAGWELTEETIKSWEFYFIRHALDQNRMVNTTEYQVKVYCDLENGGFLGSSSGVLSPGSSEEEIDQLLQDLKFRAGYVRNPMYKLVDRILTAREVTESCGQESGRSASGSPVFGERWIWPGSAEHF